MTTQTEGKREIRRTIRMYNLDLVLTIGYQVREEEIQLFSAEVQNKLLYAVTGQPGLAEPFFSICGLIRKLA